jgi:predicted ATPase/Tfp pilus assembly protein PilF
MSDVKSRLESVLSELKQRRVLRAGFAYGVIAWVAVQVAATAFPLLYLPRWTATLVVVLAILGFPATLVLAWVYDIVPGGRLRRAVGEDDPPAATDADPAVQAAIARSVGQAHGSPPSSRTPLPPAVTVLVGRLEEQRQLNSLLAVAGTRMVTISGPGGIGKTRLAQEVARAVEPHFPDGACFVSLAGRSSTSPLVPTIAESLGLTLSAGEDPAARVSSYLREKAMLLLVDNFEGFTGQAESLARILADSPGVKILLTSQERINLRGETLFPLRGLGFPSSGGEGAGGGDAAKLFLETARRADPNREFSAADLRAVARICNYVQGVPLAIELAAAWVGVLSCEEVWREIQRNRDFLVGSARDLPSRHRSLRAVFETSWALLGEPERNTFRRLSVFRGGFDRDAAMHVAGASLAELTALLEKSFLQRNPAGRLEALEILREFAAERLAEDTELAAEIATRHAAYYAQFLNLRREQLQRMADPAAANEVAVESENVREGWRWMTRARRAGETTLALDGLYAFYSARGWAREGAAAFEEAAARFAPVAGSDGEAAHVDLWHRLRARQGAFLAQLAEYDRARQLLEESLAFFTPADNWIERTLALDQLGVIATHQGQYLRADGLYRESQALSVAHGALDATGRSGIYLGQLAFTRGEYSEARLLFQEALEVFRRIGDRRRVATALKNLGGVAFRESSYSEADSLLQESLSIDRELGDPMALANSLQNLGCVAFSAGDPARAEHYLVEGTAICREMGFRRLQAFCLNELGNIYRSQGRLDEAAAHYREALAVAVEIQQVPVTLEVLLGFARIHQDLGEHERASRLVSVVLEHPASSEHSREHARQLALALPPLPPSRTGMGGGIEAAITSLLGHPASHLPTHETALTAVR